MPRARSGNFTLKSLASRLTAERCTLRMLAFQRSGQYSEMRIIQKGKTFTIMGYKWPSKTARRRLGIGRTKKNPTPTGRATPNQVLFGQRGKTLVGWINRETPTRYEITYKVGSTTRTVWRHKTKVTFQATDKKGRVRNNCEKKANPSKALAGALKLSERFHGFKPRHVRHIDIRSPRALMHVGACAQLDYISDKVDGRLRQYFHEFENPCEVFADPKPQRDGSTVLIIKGGFKLDDRGIIG